MQHKNTLTHFSFHRSEIEQDLLAAKVTLKHFVSKARALDSTLLQTFSE